MKKYIALSLAVMVIGLQTGCENTAQGAGRDIENMGKWVQDNTN